MVLMKTTFSSVQLVGGLVWRVQDGFTQVCGIMIRIAGRLGLVGTETWDVYIWHLLLAQQSHWWDILHSSLGLPERMFQETRSRSCQCVRIWFWKLSQSHFSHMLSIKEISDLP